MHELLDVTSKPSLSTLDVPRMDEGTAGMIDTQSQRQAGFGRLHD